ncbi:glycosyltransferase family 39 protein [Leifsonia sp. NPDC058230]|uniref:glycosyltransferase family 39 protein n=1 Tax=Leifsonia sp. NPDC058230 TaxID=3346391 RepID=UPI0036DE339B
MVLAQAPRSSVLRFTLSVAVTSRWKVAAALGTLAILLAAEGSWIPSLWGDEAASLLSAERPVPSLFRMLGHVDAVHGTYYLGLHWWIRVFGTSPFALRFPSAVAVGFAVAGTVAIAWRLAGRRVAVIAGLVCAVLPRVTYMGEEARSYAFSAAFAVWLTVVLLEILARPRVRRRWWVVYGILLTAGTYLFLYVALFAVVHAVLLLVARPGRRVLVPWAIAAGAAAVASFPLVVVAFLERRQIAYLATTNQITGNAVFSTLWFSTWTVAVVGWGLILFALGGAWRERGRAASAGTHQGAAGIDRPLPSLAATGAAWLAIPTIILVGGHSITPDFTPRYLSFCAPAAALVIALGLTRLSRVRRWAPLVAGTILLAAIVPVYAAQRTPYAKNGSDWAEVSSTIGANARPGDGVVFDESTKPSKRPRLAMLTYPAGFRGLVDVAVRTPFASSRTWHDSAMTVPQAERAGRFDGIRHVWLIELADGATVDSYGRADLEHLGYQEVGRTLVTHASRITELAR